MHCSRQQSDPPHFRSRCSRYLRPYRPSNFGKRGDHQRGLILRVSMIVIDPQLQDTLRYVPRTSLVVAEVHKVLDTTMQGRAIAW